MKILIADKLSPLAEELLKADGNEVRTDPSLTTDDLVTKIGDATNVLVVRSTRVTKDIIDAAGKLGLIVRAGAGFNTIDVDHASERGIYVANCPGKNADAVAELAIGLLIAADRQIVNASVDLRAGNWEKSKYGKAYGLKGRTLGLLGFGAIGKAVAKRALGMEMKVLAWSRSLTDEIADQFGVERAGSAAEVAERSDAVSVHLPLNDATQHFVDAAFLGKMRPSSILINTSRGELVDSAALAKAVEEKSLRVGIDVFENEPSGGQAAFDQVDLANIVTCTPHIGASTDQTAEAIATEVVRIIRQYRENGFPPSPVNMQRTSPAACRLTVQHLNKVGVLATILDGIRAENINVLEMQNAIFDGAKTASCTLRLDAVPASEWLERLVKNEAILNVTIQVTPTT